MSDALRAQSGLLLEAVLGVSPQPLQDLDDVLDALGENEVLLTLDWDEGVHQLVLVEARGDRVYFFNPSADQTLEAGTELGGADDTPLRRSEGTGMESMKLQILQELLTSGRAKVDEIVRPREG